MIVMKFGGTSIANAQRMKHVFDIICTRNQRRIIVLSAMAGVTDKLTEVYNRYHNRQLSEVAIALNALQSQFIGTAIALLNIKYYRDTEEEICRVFKELESQVQASDVQRASLLSVGEYLTSYIFASFCKQKGVDAIFIQAQDLIRKNIDDEIDTKHLASISDIVFSTSASTSVYITQGFICKNHAGNIDVLERGGSDFSATLIGNAVEADSIEIWSDRDGVLNNDPRHVKNTYPLEFLSYEEATELAYFGAKILHPKCLRPAQEKQIPIYVKNTLNPQAKGSVISSQTSQNCLKVAAVKEHITVVYVKSEGMFNAYGFLQKIFDVFRKNQTSVDMITTSEVAVAATIDNTLHLDTLIHDLSQFSTVTVAGGQSIITIVGNITAEQKGYAGRIFDALKTVPIRMISYGASNKSISILIDGNQQNKALNLLNKHIFIQIPCLIQH